MLPMQYKNNEDPSGEETSAHLEKFNSCRYIFFKYWLLICALWAIKDLLSPPDIDFDVEVEESIFDEILDVLGGLPLKIWDIVNYLLVFEGFRRKNLKIMEKGVTLMETYVITNIIIGFFSMTTESGLIVGKAMFQEKFPGFKGDKSSITLIAVILLLLHGLFYHFAFIYGAKKVRDTLRAHKKVCVSL